MKQTTAYLLILALSYLSVNAQDADQIKSSSEYLWGEASGTTLRKADKDALAMLINQISTTVESDFELLKEEAGDDYKETFKSIVKTYSSATLRNTERLVLSNEPDAKVFRYIKKSELNKIFEERKKKILDFAQNGIDAAAEYKVADALKYYYWSVLLLKSHPYAGSITNASGQLMMPWLSKQINDVFSDVKVKIGDLQKESTYSTQLLHFYYKNKPVTNIDYSYWDGKDWSNNITAKDGLGFIEFTTPEPDFKSIKLKIEYMFEGEAAIDKELSDVMEKLDPVSFRTSYLNLRTDNPVSIKKTESIAQKVSQTEQKEFLNKHKNLESVFKPVENTLPYKHKTDSLKMFIKAKQYQKAKALFTEQGYEVFTNLINYGNAKILAETQLNFAQYKNEVICRAIPMSFSFKNNNKQFVEDVVIVFNEDKKISNLSFSLCKKAIDDIAGNEVWSENVKMNILNFMENYQTAYALKRLDYIDKIFSDNALIITTTVLNVKNIENNKYIDNKIVKYNRMDKAKYMKRLEMCFNSNEFINLKFEDNNIRKSGMGNEVYGIQIKQYYTSTNYADEGYLFLLIDFEDEENPIIQVRTWQPEKNPDGSIYGLGDFN